MYRLRTFGGATLYHDGLPLDGAAAQRRRLALLALLAWSGDGGLSRDRLLAMLWPDADAASARHTLSQWLHLLRRDLRAEDVVTGTADLRLNPSHVTCDLWDFRTAIAAGDLDAACAAYTGAFLDGFHLSDAAEFERWHDIERADLSAQWRRAAESLAVRRRNDGDHAGAVELWRRLAASDPYDARVALQLMRALADAGDTAAAVTHAAIHSALVREELGEEPAPEIAALASTLRSTPARAMSVIAAPPEQPSPASAAPESPASPTLEAQARTAPAEAGATSVAGSHRSRRLLWLAAAVVPFVFAVSAFRMVPPDMRALVRTLRSRPPATLNRHRIVIAPLANESGDTTLAAFGDMAADWAAQELARTGEFDVTDARTAIVTTGILNIVPAVLRGDRALALAREVGAARVVSGRFYLDGDSLRVQASVMDVATGAVEQVVRPIVGDRRHPTRVVELFARQIAATAAASLDSSLAGVGVARSAPPSFDAYRETIRAWNAYYQGDLPRFFLHASAAAASDTSYMLPLVMMGHVRLGLRQWDALDSLVRTISAHRHTLAPVELAGLDLLSAGARGDVDGAFEAAVQVARAVPASPEARTNAARLAIAANRPRAALAELEPVDPNRGLMLVVPWYWTMKTAAQHLSGDFSAEYETAGQGLRQFPDEPALLAHRGKALAALGRLSELDELSRHASPRLPRASLRWSSVFRHAMLCDWARELRAHGHPVEAAILTRQVLTELEASRPDTASRAIRVHAMALVDAGRWTEARGLFAELAARDSLDVASRGQLGVLAARMGLREEAERVSRTLMSTGGVHAHGVETMWRARIAAAAGEVDASIRLVTEAVAQGYARGYDDRLGGSWGEYELHDDPTLEPVRSLPAFALLLSPKG